MTPLDPRPAAAPAEDDATPRELALFRDWYRGDVHGVRSFTVFRMWRENGGHQHGPNVETATIPMSRLHAFLSEFADTLPVRQSLDDTARQLAEAHEEIARLKGELDETWDDGETIWRRPTPWAYAQACKVVKGRQLTAEIRCATLKAERDAAREALIEVCDDLEDELNERYFHPNDIRACNAREEQIWRRDMDVVIRARAVIKGEAK